jgi:hypothetical protein
VQQKSEDAGERERERERERENCKDFQVSQINCSLAFDSLFPLKTILQTRLFEA